MSGFGSPVESGFGFPVASGFGFRGSAIAGDPGGVVVVAVSRSGSGIFKAYIVYLEDNTVRWEREFSTGSSDFGVANGNSHGYQLATAGPSGIYAFISSFDGVSITHKMYLLARSNGATISSITPTVSANSDYNEIVATDEYVYRHQKNGKIARYDADLSNEVVGTGGVNLNDARNRPWPWCIGVLDDPWFIEDSIGRICTVTAAPVLGRNTANDYPYSTSFPVQAPARMSAYDFVANRDPSTISWWQSTSTEQTTVLSNTLASNVCIADGKAFWCQTGGAISYLQFDRKASHLATTDSEQIETIDSGWSDTVGNVVMLNSFDGANVRAFPLLGISGSPRQWFEFKASDFSLVRSEEMYRPANTDVNMMFADQAGLGIGPVSLHGVEDYT